MTINRRTLLRSSGLLAVAAIPISKALAADCAITPTQTAGPFYPVQDQDDKDRDLTRVQGQAGLAAGTVVNLSGVVRQTSCGSAIAGAMVEIWQACATGKYNHPDDPNTAALDENFQYWGRVTTDAAGRYSFKTIKPGAYPADPTWMRPPHIHFRIVAAGQPTLVTQMYFAGDPYNARDQILRQVPAAQRSLVVIPFTEANGELTGTFDVLLSRRIGNPDGTPELD